jgi:hypothetical protein
VFVRDFCRSASSRLSGPFTGTIPVDDQDYQVPFEFNGKLIKLTLTIDQPKLSPADLQKLQAAQRNNKVSE